MFTIEAQLYHKSFRIIIVFCDYRFSSIHLQLDIMCKYIFGLFIVQLLYSYSPGVLFP